MQIHKVIKHRSVITWIRIWGHWEKHEVKVTKGYEEISRSVRYTHYLDCGDSFTRIYKKPSGRQIKYVQFVVCRLNQVKL